LLAAVSAVEAFHADGFLGHNDLRPGNILYTVERNHRFRCCYIIDFGHAMVYKSAPDVHDGSSDLRRLVSLCNNLLGPNSWDHCRTLLALSAGIEAWLLHYQQLDHVIIKNADGQVVRGKVGGQFVALMLSGG
jgi:serine/threonine protein kinase